MKNFRRLIPTGVLLVLLCGTLCRFALDEPARSAAGPIGTLSCHQALPASDCAGMRFSSWEWLGRVLCSSARNRSDWKTLSTFSDHSAISNSCEELYLTALGAAEPDSASASPGWNDFHYILPKRAGPEVC